jgi:hypothetical protein
MTRRPAATRAIPALAALLLFAGTPAHARSRNMTAYLHGTVEKVDPGGHTLSLGRLPFWEFFFRDTARDCAVDPSVDLANLRVGTKVVAFLRRTQTGGYTVRSIRPQ